MKLKQPSKLDMITHSAHHKPEKNLWQQENKYVNAITHSHKFWFIYSGKDKTMNAEYSTDTKSLMH